MKKCMILKKIAEKCSEKAADTDSELLRMFYQKAEKGFLIKAKKLLLDQNGEKI